MARNRSLKYPGYGAGARSWANAATRVGLEGARRVARHYYDKYQSANRRKSAKRVTYTTGYSGPKFKRPKVTATSSYLKSGWVEAVEAGGERSSLECPYLGHSFGHGQVFKAAVAAIIRKMLQMMAFRIASWDDEIIQATGSISPGGYRLTYRVTVGGEFNVVSEAFALNASWQSIVDQITLKMKTVIGGTNVSTISFDELVFWQTDSLGIANSMARSRVFINDVVLDFNCDSTMSIQNRTVASNSVSDGDVFSKDNILNNPLGGKSYEGSGTGTQLREERNTTNLGDYFVGSSDSGVIQFDSAATTGISASQQKILKRPPAKNAWTRVQRDGNIMLNPGQIRMSKLYFKRKITFCKLCTLLFPTLRSTVPDFPILVSLGSFRFFGFEKKCNTRVNENSIELGYELNAVYRCKVSLMNRGVAVVNNIIT